MGSIQKNKIANNAREGSESGSMTLVLGSESGSQNIISLYK
jgi:hypothetical protein